MKLFTACEHAWAVRYCGRVHGTEVIVLIETCVHCGRQVARDGEVVGEMERWLAEQDAAAEAS